MVDLVGVRSVDKNDYMQWKVLWDKYNTFYDREDFPLEITELTWSRFFDKNEPIYAMVAEIEGNVIGIVHYLFHRSTSRIELSCYLQDLYVNENMRGQGVARKLIEAVYQKAKTSGSKRVYWQTKEDNLRARKLYDKVADLSGFIVYNKEI